ncbi:type II secretion system F family protein [Methylophaga sp. OBS3]|uniref:type II secretion system F family protein n=1 Tax=Methylophaga sp. OBS3 TaxID=2991934 RepID=UPI00225884EB|nr:type II secretion system F family protein [Methylophaga sp. OBS3]MCX4189648.1 type II secretion system F family protein [Methylophaga sp. OBS3]
MTIFIVIYAMSGLLMVLAFVAVARSGKQELSEKTNEHFSKTAGMSIDGRRLKERRRQSNSVKAMFWRAGLQPQEKHYAISITITLILMALVGINNGFVAALMVPFILLVTLYLWLWQRANARVKMILLELPLFLDQVLRALGTGRSMESALQLAASETPDPLKEIFERVLRANRLGDDLGQSIQQVAELYRVQELYLVSLAIRVNRIYGSSVRDLLNNIVKMIHSREAARRELRTMTGETRVTAWVLGVLPLLIAGYIMMMNPGYLLTMWEDEGGKYMLITAVAFQGLGAFVLWRMIKSI